MSDPTAEPSPGALPARRAGLGGALGMLLGLALLGAALWYALRPGAGFVDPASELARAFELGELPFGLEPAEAVRLEGGVLVVSLAAPSRPAAPPRAPSDLILGAEPASDGAPPEPERGTAKVDWAGLGPLGSGAAPERAYLVRWPVARAELERRRLFEGLRFRDAKDLGPRGGRALLARVDLPWQGLAARAVHERSYRIAAGAPTFFESIRVDLARRDEPWMLVALWPERQGADLAAVRGLVAALGPR